MPPHLQGSVDTATAAAATMTPNLSGGRGSPEGAPPELDLSGSGGGGSSAAASAAPAAAASDPAPPRLLIPQPPLPGMPLISEECGLDSGGSTARTAVEDGEEALADRVGRGKSMVFGASPVPLGAPPAAAEPPPPQRRHSAGPVASTAAAVAAAAASAARRSSTAAAVDGIVEAAGASPPLQRPPVAITADIVSCDSPVSGVDANPYDAAAVALRAAGEGPAGGSGVAPRAVAALGIASGVHPRTVTGLLSSGRSVSASRLPADGGGGGQSGRSAGSVGPWADSARAGAAKDGGGGAAGEDGGPLPPAAGAPLAPGAAAARLRRLPAAEDDGASVSSGTSAGNTDTLSSAIAGRIKSSAYFSLSAALGVGAAGQSTAERIESMRASAQVRGGDVEDERGQVVS